MPRVDMSEVERFYGQVSVDDNGYVIWTGRTVPAGPHKGDRYGMFTTAGRTDVLAHVWAWEHEHGPIPPGHRLFRRHRGVPKTCVDPEMWETREYGRVRLGSPEEAIRAVFKSRGVSISAQEVDQLAKTLKKPE
ncbi:MAG: hypothetical protein WD208_07690 [Dehalococcoidia bacterium]